MRGSGGVKVLFRLAVLAAAAVALGAPLPHDTASLRDVQSLPPYRTHWSSNYSADIALTDLVKRGNSFVDAAAKLVDEAATPLQGTSSRLPSGGEETLPLARHAYQDPSGDPLTADALAKSTPANHAGGAGNSPAALDPIETSAGKGKQPQATPQAASTSTARRTSRFYERKEEVEDLSDLNSQDLTRVKGLVDRVRLRIYRLEKEQPEAYFDTWAIWNRKMVTEEKLYEQARAKLAQLKGAKPRPILPRAQPGMSRVRPSNFVGLTEDEVDFFHSTDPSSRKLLRDRLKNRIAVARKNAHGVNAEQWLIKLHTDLVWQQGMQLLKTQSSADAAKAVQEVLDKIASLSAVEAERRLPRLLADMLNGAAHHVKVARPRLEQIQRLEAEHQGSTSTSQALRVPEPIQQHHVPFNRAELPRGTLFAPVARRPPAHNARPHSPTPSTASADLFAKYLETLEKENPNASSASNSHDEG